MTLILLSFRYCFDCINGIFKCRVTKASSPHSNYADKLF